MCFLWSIVNPVHEVRFAGLLDEHLAGIPYTLSHQLNPTIREYRRASSTSIDVSLKPLISQYLTELTDQLQAAGFRGRPLMVTSGGGLLDFQDVIKAPIHSLGSGPRHGAGRGAPLRDQETALENAIVTDAGGTSFDVSLLRKVVSR